MTTVAGIDPSLTNAGVVTVSDTSQDHPGMVWPWIMRSCGRPGHKNETYKTRSRRVRKQVRDILEILIPAGKLDLVVIEGPIYGGNFLPSYFDRAGLFHGVYGALDARGIPIAVIPPTTGHQFMTGKGRPTNEKGQLDKTKIVDGARKMFPEVNIASHDIADALGYALMGAMAIDMRLPFLPRRWQHEAVHVSEWPTHNGRPGKLAAHV